MPKPTPKPGYTFTPGPDPEALRYFRAKGLKPAFDYRDVWREEHAFAFTVAKITELDLLSDVRDSLTAAMREGKAFQKWKRELRPELEKRGWWGIKTMTDPTTGEARPVQLGSPRRLRTIFHANVRTAHAAGKWERIQRTRESHPFLIYRLGPAREHRPQHAAWNGLILPADAPFWGSHFPPNGWGCKCYVRQVTARETARRGGPSTPPPIKKRRWKNRRTGRVELVPVGIDPGWDTNPGLARAGQLGKMLEEKREVFTASFGAPPPPRLRLWPEGEEGVFSTVRGVTGTGFEDVLERVPGAAPQVEAMGKFMQKHRIKCLVLKAGETRKGAAGEIIAERVGRFLGPPWPRFPKQAFAPPGVSRALGFTSRSYNHVVVKAKGRDALAQVKVGELSRAVELAIASHRGGAPGFTMNYPGGAVYGDTPEGIVLTFAHEVGHQVHFKAGTPLRPKGLPALTRYAASNSREWHAEHFTAWLVNRKALKEWSPDVVQYFDGLMESVIKRAP